MIFDGKLLFRVIALLLLIPLAHYLAYDFLGSGSWEDIAARQIIITCLGVIVIFGLVNGPRLLAFSGLLMFVVGVVLSPLTGNGAGFFLAFVLMGTALVVVVSVVAAVLGLLFGWIRKRFFSEPLSEKVLPWHVAISIAALAFVEILFINTDLKFDLGF